MKFAIYQTSRQGGRQYNQDRVAYAYSRDALLMVVADGMGGHFHGEVAAQIAVELIADSFRKQAQPTLRDPLAFLKASMENAHEAIDNYAKERHLSDHPRTTCVACVVQQDVAYWAHVGDSRLYFFRDGKLLTRTRDHSRVQMLFDQGRISEAQMNTHPERNKIYNCLGGDFPPDVELSARLSLVDGDKLLLCSDGLWGMLAVNEIASILEAYPLQHAIEELLNHAEYRAGQGSDNLSGVGLAWGEQGQAVNPAAISTAVMSRNAVSTQMQGFQADAAAFGNEDIEQAISEIQAAIKKYSK